VSIRLTADSEKKGEILSNHEAEVILKDAAPEVVFVRCAYFMENWGMALETLPQGFFFTTLTPLDYGLPMVRPGKNENLTGKSKTESRLT
jgi:uncharacterized protein YbjT (DUF2867 family)